MHRCTWQRPKQSSGASDCDDPGAAWPGLPQPPAIAREALLPKQAAADKPPALDRLQVAGLPVVIAGEDGKARLNVEPERGFVPEDEGDGVIFDVSGEIHFLQGLTFHLGNFIIRWPGVMGVFFFLFLVFVRVGEVMGGLLSAQDHPRPANRQGNTDCCVTAAAWGCGESATGRESVSLQLVIPRRVALQQSPLALHQLGAILREKTLNRD